MKYSYPNSKILVFAKEPVAGKVKTRLQSHLGETGALSLHCALISYQVEQILATGLAPVELWVSSNAQHELFQSLVPQESIYVQKGADLGNKMDHAFEQSLKTSEAVLIVGADCPSIDKEYLVNALEALQDGNDAVFGPAEDGGYVLVGLTSRQSQLFKNVPWGGSLVMLETRNRLECSGLNWHLLGIRWDVDRPQDLAKLAELEPPLHY